MARDNGKGKRKAEESRGQGKGKRREKGKMKEKGKAKEKGKGSSTSSRTVVRTTSPSPSRSSSEPPPSPRNSTTERIIGPSKPRSHSQGLAGKNPPMKPKRVDIHGGHIFDNEAKKTMLGTIRNHWPKGAYCYRDISSRDPEWLKDICDEFKTYYKHQKGQSRSEADYTIELHAKNTCRRLISDEKDRWKKKKANKRFKGLSDEQLCPPYFHPDLWDGLLKFWNSEAHKHRAKVGSENRKKVDTLHSAGAKSFEAHEMDMINENNGKKPPLLKLWERTHTTAASRRARATNTERSLVFTSPQAMEIFSRYGAILEAQGVNLNELTPASKLDEPIEWWLAATTGNTERPEKNRIIGFPTIPASQLLSNLAHRFRERARDRASSSSSSANRPPVIPDQTFLQIVRNAVTNAQADPTQFGNLNNSELEDIARNIIEVSDPASRGNFNQLFFREVVNVVSTIITSICNNTQAAIDQANKDSTTDEESDEGDGEPSSADEDDGMDDEMEDDDDVGGDNVGEDTL